MGHRNDSIVAAVVAIASTVVILHHTDGRSMSDEEEPEKQIINTNFFHNIYNENMSDAAFRSAFRMGRQCFDHLVCFLEDALTKHTVMQDQARCKYPLKIKLAIVLSYLGPQG